MNEFSTKIKAIRQGLNLTQKEFAERVGMKQSAYSMVESGKNKPSFEFLAMVVERFNINGSEFFEQRNILNDNTIVTTDGSLDSMKRQASNVTELTTPAVTQEKPLDIGESTSMGKYLTSYYTNDPQGIVIKRLKDLGVSYTKKINRELQHEYRNLHQIRLMAENIDSLIEDIGDFIANNINNRPDPFEISQYIDFTTRTETIPETIDYDDYKQSIIDWLNRISPLKKEIDDFYVIASEFLTASKKAQNIQSSEE